MRPPRRRPVDEPHGLYKELVGPMIERKRGAHARYGHLPGAPWHRELDRLEAELPVEVNASKLPGGARRYGLDPEDWVRVHRDDRVELVEAAVEDDE